MMDYDVYYGSGCSILVNGIKINYLNMKGVSGKWTLYPHMSYYTC